MTDHWRTLVLKERYHADTRHETLHTDLNMTVSSNHDWHHIHQVTNYNEKPRKPTVTRCSTKYTATQNRMTTQKKTPDRQLGTNRRIDSHIEDIPEERRWATLPQSSLTTFYLFLFCHHYLFLFVKNKVTYC